MRVTLQTLSLTSETRLPVRDSAPKTRPVKFILTTTAPTPLNLKPASSSQTPDYKSLPPSVTSARQDHLSAKLIKSVRRVSSLTLTVPFNDYIFANSSFNTTLMTAEKDCYREVQ